MLEGPASGFPADLALRGAGGWKGGERPHSDLGSISYSQHAQVAHVIILAAAFAGPGFPGRRFIVAVIQGLQDLAKVFGIADAAHPPK